MLDLSNLFLRDPFQGDGHLVRSVGRDEHGVHVSGSLVADLELEPGDRTAPVEVVRVPGDLGFGAVQECCQWSGHGSRL